MSFLALSVAPGHVEVCTDTVGYDFEGVPLGLYTKFCVMPHCGSMIAGRGPAVFTVEVSKQAIATALADVDQLIDAMPVLMGRVCDEYLTAYAAAGVAPPISPWGLLQLVVIGWSPARKRMVAQNFKHDGEATVSDLLTDGSVFSPHPDDPDLALASQHSEIAALRKAHARDIDRFRSPQTFIAFAKMAHIVARGRVGGELILCRVTRFETSIRKIYRFDDADDMLAEMRGLDPAEAQARLGYNIAGEFETT